MSQFEFLATYALPLFFGCVLNIMTLNFQGFHEVPKYVAPRDDIGETHQYFIIAHKYPPQHSVWHALEGHWFMCWIISAC